MELFILAIILLLAVTVVIFYALSRLINALNALLVFALFISGLLFLNDLSSYQQDYYELANGLTTNYTPFASAHSPTLFTFIGLSLAALVLVWIKQRALSPLIMICAVGMILIGVIIHSVIIMQVINTIEPHEDTFYLLPVVYIIITVITLKRLLNAEASVAADRTYKSGLLNRLNKLVANSKWQPMWMLLFTLPVFVIAMLVLIIFGQDGHAITKVFTETTTWHFSTKTHPPLLDYQGGHYLCTVAACGDANVVKPLGWGCRNGYPILVNRQLQVANAFEELIQVNLPALHYIVRRFYDKYGYPLSTKITQAKHSNITYQLMKPLEYFFLLILYACYLNPEHKIAKQYAITPPNN